MIRAGWLAVRIAATAILALPPTLARGQSLECSDWLAVDSIPIDQQVTALGWFTIDDRTGVDIEVRLGDGLKRTEILAYGSRKVDVALFRAWDGSVHLVLRKVNDEYGAYGKIDGETVDGLSGGRVPKPERVLKKRVLNDLGGEACVRVASKPVLMSPTAARSLAVDVVVPDAPAGFVTEVPPRGDIGDVFGLPDDGGAKFVSPPKGSLGILFEEPTTADASRTTAPPEAERDDATVETAEAPKDIDAAVEELVAQAAAVPETICVAGEDVPLPFNDAKGAEQFTVAGRLLPSADLRAFRRLPGIDDLTPEDGSFQLSPNADEQLHRLVVPFALQTVERNGVANIQAMRPVDGTLVSTAPVVTGPELEDISVPEVAALMDLLVIGDAATTAESGLEKLEADLLDKLGQRVWNVEWAQVMPDGQIAAPVAFPGLTGLVTAARAAPESAFFGQNTDDFDQLMKGIENVLIGDGPIIHQVLMLQEGYTLPHTAPTRFEQMILAVQARGRIERFPDGRPRKWLQLIAGTFSAPFSEAYLDGPIKTTEAGYMLTEKRDAGVRTTILTETAALQASLEIILDRRSADAGVELEYVDLPSLGEPGAAEGAGIDGDLFFPRTDFVQKIGLVVRQDILEVFLKSLSETEQQLQILNKDPESELADASGLLDIVALMTLRTDARGALKPETLTGTQLKRSREALRVRRGDEFIERLPEWQTAAIVNVVSAMSLPECGFVFFPLGSLIEE